MSKTPSGRVPAKIINEDIQAFHGLGTIQGYAPHDPDLTLEAITATYDELMADRAALVRAQIALDIIRDNARRARNEFGYLRMWSIHPNQIVPIFEAMRPDFSEVESAAAILVAAQDNDWGPIRHHGQLHDRASYRYYWELLNRAQTMGMDIDTTARQRFFTA